MGPLFPLSQCRVFMVCVLIVFVEYMRMWGMEESECRTVSELATKAASYDAD